MMNRLLMTTVMLGLTAGWAGPARGQTCEAGTTQDALGYLRRLSLDLRGRLPSFAELERVAATGSVDPALIAEMLASEDLVQQMRAMHRELLWTNVLDQRLSNNNFRLRAPSRRVAGGTSPAYWIPSNGRATGYRGAQTPCLDEPARFDPETGAILTTPDENDPTIRREGWVEVSPYWSPSTTVRVCAFEAQETLTIEDGARPIDCSTAANEPRCGCGPNLRWCESADDQTRVQILDSMNEQLLRFTDEIFRADRPYTDVLLSKEMEVNGPISHYLRHQTRTGGADAIIAGPDQNHPVPEISFEETENWVRVERELRHAGVLTMPAYLLKFQSDRGRANRFYNAFLCQHFEATAALPPATDPCHAEPDLTKRCGCKDCHIAVEPAAAYWGRWAEAGLLPLDEPLFPKQNGCCVDGGECSPAMRRLFNRNTCGRFYLTDRELTGPDDPQAQYLGMLEAYVFADATRERNIEEGPELLARQAIDSGAFASCTVRRLWRRFMAREATLDEEQTLAELTTTFSQGYNLRRLIAELVVRPEYVQAGRFTGKGAAE